MIEVDALWKSHGDHDVLRGISFRVDRGQVYTLLGPSGCGKTTSLRAIAGVETPDRGRITLGGRVAFCARERINLSPDRRRIGMVFQSYAIWPHMTVAQNVAYPLEAQGVRSTDIGRRVAHALDIVGLRELADRPAPHLSGGQQQRVALARAIVAEPDVLLLDEPLSNLDAKLRGQMRRDLASLQQQLQHTTVYVTHDQEEALALSDRIALMRDGEIVEEGDPVAMYQHPRHPFSAAFLGAANFIACDITGRPRDGERVEVETAFGRFQAVARRGEEPDAKLFFRPHHVELLPPGTASGPNQGRGQVTQAQFLGEGFDVTLREHDTVVSVRSPASAPPPPGREVAFSVDPAFCIAFVPDIAPG